MAHLGWDTQLKTVALAKNRSSTQVDGAIREQLSGGHLGGPHSGGP